MLLLKTALLYGVKVIYKMQSFGVMEGDDGCKLVVMAEEDASMFWSGNWKGRTVGMLIFFFVQGITI